MIDLRPAALRTSDLISSVTEDQFGLPTPCPDARLGDLIDHIGTFATAFTAAARKEAEERSAPPPHPRWSNLEEGWRDRITEDLSELAAAWADPAAWDGATLAGSIRMPAASVGLVALDELVVHGWDIAVATSQPYDPPESEIDAAMSWVGSFDVPRDGRLFGPVVHVPSTASALDRLLGITGRDPQWKARG